MILLPIVFAILFCHWVADFVLQTHEQAINKSKSVRYLTAHVASYTLAMCVTMPVFLAIFHSWLLAGLIGIRVISFSAESYLLWIAINGLLHWITDYYTSKWTNKLWRNQKVHDFFVVIGFDQLLHMISLFSTWYFIV